jgi:hypothetical protein
MRHQILLLAVVEELFLRHQLLAILEFLENLIRLFPANLEYL